MEGIRLSSEVLSVDPVLSSNSCSRRKSSRAGMPANQTSPFSSNMTSTDRSPLSGRALEACEPRAASFGNQVEFLVVASAKGKCLLVVDVERTGDERIDQCGRRAEHSADGRPRISGEHQYVRFGLRPDSRQEFEQGIGLIERLASGDGDAVGRRDPRSDGIRRLPRYVVFPRPWAQVSIEMQPGQRIEQP